MSHKAIWRIVWTAIVIYALVVFIIWTLFPRYPKVKSCDARDDSCAVGCP
jgi:hypothetical protein